MSDTRFSFIKRFFSFFFKGKNSIETILGAVVLCVAFYFLIFVYTTSDLKYVDGYTLNVRFTQLGALDKGSDVLINGIKVGTVTDQYLDQQDFTAVLTLSLRPEVRLPDDTVASIASDGLLGGKYVKLEPGHSSSLLQEGAFLTHSKSYKSLEDSVSEIIFLVTQDPVQKEE